MSFVGNNTKMVTIGLIIKNTRNGIPYTRKENPRLVYGSLASHVGLNLNARINNRSNATDVGVP